MIAQHGLPVSIRDSSYEYSSLDELAEKRGAHPTAFSLHGSRKETFDRITVGWHDRRWSLSADGKELGALPTRVRDLIQDRRAPLSRVLRPLVWFFVSLGATTVAGAVSPTISETAPWLAALPIATLALWVVSLIYRRVYLGVTLLRRHQGSFWRRNSDKIGLLLLGAVIGALVTQVANLLAR